MAQYLFSVWHIGAYPTPSEEEMAAMFAAAVSYTHLTLPTSDLV